MKLSVVIALKDESPNVGPLLAEIDQALASIDHEVILVDDGSTDDTAAQVLAHARPNTRLLVFQRNYGQTMAMRAGIDAAKGEFIATLDGDLQNNPHDIPWMLDRLVEGDFDVVAGRRAVRKDGWILRKIPSAMANMLIRWLTGVYIRDYGCTLKVFRPIIAKNLGMYGELHRFIPVLASLQGARITEADVDHRARLAGTSKYGLGRTFRVASDLMLMLFFQKYFRRPMHLFGPIGYVCLMLGFGMEMYLLVLKIMGEEIGGRPMLMAGILLILAGLQMLTFGLMAEIQMRTYYESQGKAPYLIRHQYEGGQKV